MRILSAPVLLPLFAALLLAPAAGPLHAQEGTVTGQVRDATSGEPLAGAIVELPARRIRAVTGPDGEFELRGVPRGEQRWETRRIGYDAWEQTHAAAEGERITILLEPNAVALARIEVVTDRLARRRHRSTESSRVIEQAEILGYSGASALDLVLSRAIPTRIRCPGNQALLDHEPCVYTRGQVRQATLCIDEAPAFFDQLIGYPRESLYAIESYQNGRTIRVYTTAFMESNRPISAEAIGCGIGARRLGRG
jgi:hypothetical protein